MLIFHSLLHYACVKCATGHAVRVFCFIARRIHASQTRISRVRIGGNILIVDRHCDCLHGFNSGFDDNLTGMPSVFRLAVLVMEAEEQRHFDMKVSLPSDGAFCTGFEIITGRLLGINST